MSTQSVLSPFPFAACADVNFSCSSSVEVLANASTGAAKVHKMEVPANMRIASTIASVNDVNTILLSQTDFCTTLNIGCSSLAAPKEN